MITQPSAARLLEVARSELLESVLPAIDDPHAQASVHMLQQILSTMIVRAEHEIAWLLAETDELELLGTQIVEQLPAAARVADALVALRAAPGGSYLLSDVARRYSIASEILSCAFEEVPTAAPLRASVEAALDNRLEHESAIIGDFSLVGRT
jgi:hypothetical protein